MFISTLSIFFRFFICIYFFGLGWTSPAYIFLGLGPAQPTWAGLDPASPARSLAQASDPAGQDAHIVKVIKLPSHCVQ